MGIQGIVMTITSDFREGTLTVKRKCVCERESRDKRETELEEGSNRKIDAWPKIICHMATSTSLSYCQHCPCNINALSSFVKSNS